MSDKALASLLTALILAALAVWVPLLEALARLRRPRSAAVLREVQPNSGGSQQKRAGQRSIA